MTDTNLENVDIHEKENDDLFLDLIKERPALYDKSMKDHHDKIVIENAMQEIAHIMNQTVEQCEQRWKRLQNTFAKEKYLQDVLTRSGAGASSRRKWQFYERMQNLLSRNQSRPSYTNIPSTCGETFDNSPKQAPFNAINYNSKKKKKLVSPMESAFNQIHKTMNEVIDTVRINETSTPQNTTDNPDELFEKLVAAELNELSSKVAKKKRKLMIICLAEEDSDDENSVT